ncbi:MAG: beta-lactamase family protein [Chloroflexi bacterium]|nr:beta-lactamase family protein [Chloroflexota bacterium]
MRRTPIVVALILLLLATVGPASMAQVETPVPSEPTTPIATPLAAAQPDLTDVTPLPLTGERRAEFEAYVAEAMNRLGVPGASIAVVRGGEIVYLQGFGVREDGGTKPVTPDTLMMIGSVTKSMTSTMAATLVDDGWLSWETPLVALLPGFAVTDPRLTPRLTVADAFCACTGLPRRDPEVLFNFASLTPEEVIAQVAELPLTAPFGEQFQYSNQLYALGGYAAAAAAGAAPDDLYGGYQLAMRERLLNPIGMPRSTFALEEVLASGDYALPHSVDLEGQTRPVPLLTDEGFVSAVAPAGALWSTAREMARYVQTELANGLAPDGTRVVSSANLERTRAPRVSIPAEPGLPPVFVESAQYYGMGWLSGSYYGQPLLSHSGGTLGFGSEVAFLPEADLGIVILTNNVQAGGPFALAVQFRLFELLFDQPPAFDALMGQFLDAQMGQIADLRAQLRPIDPTAVGLYLGRYVNPALGEVALALRDGRLVFDAGELRSELQPQLDDAGQVAYVFADPPLAGAPVPVTLRQGADGRPELVATVQGEGEETYVFTLLESSGVATPVPE